MYIFVNQKLHLFLLKYGLCCVNCLVGCFHLNTDSRDYVFGFCKKCCTSRIWRFIGYIISRGGFDQDFGPLPIWQSSDDGTVLGWQCRFQIRTRHHSTKHKSWCKYKLALWSLHGSLVNDHWSVKTEPYHVWIWCKCSLTYQPIQHKTLSVRDARNILFCPGIGHWDPFSDDFHKFSWIKSEQSYCLKSSV